jgi:hypothetical protein
VPDNWAPMRTSLHRLARRASLGAALGAALLGGGCSGQAPPPIGGSALAEAQTFPYYRIYWVGPSFAGHVLVAADGRNGYDSSIGDGVYYGNCVSANGGLTSGGCSLPLQVLTVVYRLHSNAALGPQRNTLIRGVPATSYDRGNSIELYTGRLAIDVFSDTPSHALLAAARLRPLNAPGSASAPLPPPVYCPGLSASVPGSVQRVMAALPGHPCQSAAATASAAALGR